MLRASFSLFLSMEIQLHENIYARSSDENFAQGHACKFIVFRSSDTNGHSEEKLMTDAFGVWLTHRRRVEQLELTSETIVGGGKSVNSVDLSHERTEWNSSTLMELCGHDRPEDPEEAERILVAVKEAIFSARQHCARALAAKAETVDS